MSTDLSKLTPVWQRNNEATLFLLEQVPERALSGRYSERTRTVAAQFAHIHNVRIYHLEKRGRGPAENLSAFERGAQPKKNALRTALRASAEAIEKLLAQCEAKEKVPSWTGTPASFLGYLIAHEAHHRALAVVSLRLSGNKLPSEALYRIWNWGKKGPL